MARSSFFAESTTANHPVDEVIEQSNALFARLKHPRQKPADGEPVCVHASFESAEYIRAFWPHLRRLIHADPRKLGLSVEQPGDRLEIGEIQRSILDRGDSLGNETEVRLMTTTIAPLTMMSRILNEATDGFAEDLSSGRGRCPLSFELDPARFVSLRTLFPRKDRQGRVGGNAPTLVMGGTATAVAMCWNLLHRMPRAYYECEQIELDRDTAEQIWAQTRELIFRIGGGSLAAFVALASACSSDAAALKWDGAKDLGLATSAGRYVWTMNSALLGRFDEILTTVRESQKGHYVGCAALFARAEPLPLSPDFADAVSDDREPTVFSELIRWITAVARAEYFPQFEKRG